MLDVRAILWLETYLQVGGWQEAPGQSEGEGRRHPPGWCLALLSGGTKHCALA